MPGDWPLPRTTFEPLKEMRLPNSQAVDRERLASYYASMGWLADLPDEERLPLVDEVVYFSRLPSIDGFWETQAYRTTTDTRAATDHGSRAS